MVDPWAAPGTWLRCALHAHTTRSDGELEPDALAAHYARGGFDVLAVTDHGRVTDARPAGDLLVLPGAELNCVLPEGHDGHVLAFGIGADEEEVGEIHAARPSQAQLSSWIGAHGGVAYLAHPYWTGIPAGAIELSDGITGIEVYNAGCELECGRGLAGVHWDELLGAGRLCPALATDDSHHPGFDSGHAWTWARTRDRTIPAVLDALATGAFYASCGPVLHEVVRDGDALEVRTSPSRSVTLVSRAKAGAAANAGRLGYRYGATLVEEDEQGMIVRARLELGGLAGYARLEVTDAQGRRAWANPFAL
jgi:hypothetical protein